MASGRSLYAIITMALGISQAARTFLTGLEQQPWRLENFTKELFWEQPPDGKRSYFTKIIGLYEVDVGLKLPQEGT